jgi:chemotaxis protein CheD
MGEQVARMGELVVSSVAEDELACIGLGSCIGLTLLDRRAGVAGLAHVMLPSAPAEARQPAKFADLAVDALLAAVEREGAVKRRLEAIIVGGAQMFAFGAAAGKDIGRRNEAAVREELTRVRVPLVAHETGGSSGRSMRVYVGRGHVTCRQAAGAVQDLVGAPSATRIAIAA